jgi:hypothetical protein
MAKVRWDQYEGLLGTMTDARLAVVIEERTGVSITPGTVGYQRRKRGIPTYSPPEREHKNLTLKTAIVRQIERQAEQSGLAQCEIVEHAVEAVYGPA